jgi:glycosyltransferase involved in cell wall biosynthesis
MNQSLDDSDLRQSFSGAARLRARNEFSLETITSRTRALYDKVMQAER